MKIKSIAIIVLFSIAVLSCGTQQEPAAVTETPADTCKVSATSETLAPVQSTDAVAVTVTAVSTSTTK